MPPINCTFLCSMGMGGAICDCNYSPPPVFQAINNQNPASGLSNIDPPDCTVLCSTGDGGAACDCHNIPPGIAPIDFRDTDPVNPSEPNCTVLCKTGDGGAACDCGDTPPGAYAPPDSSAHGLQVKYNHNLPVPCSKWCAVLPEKAPNHCGCKTRPALKAPPPLPPKGADSRICRVLCDQGRGGSICECSRKASNPAPTPDPDPAPLPYNPAIDCFFLCDTGKGGSLCDCGDMPPAPSSGVA